MRSERLRCSRRISGISVVCSLMVIPGSLRATAATIRNDPESTLSSPGPRTRRRTPSPAGASRSRVRPDVGLSDGGDADYVVATGEELAHSDEFPKLSACILVTPGHAGLRRPVVLPRIGRLAQTRLVSDPPLGHLSRAVGSSTSARSRERGCRPQRVGLHVPWPPSTPFRQ